MRVRAQAFRLPKHGNSEEEYEDACWPERFSERAARVFRCAVADGATEASFAGLWADLLVRSYCRGELSGDKLTSTLPVLGQRWRAAVATRPLPWYAEEKLRSGAFAALAGLTISATQAGVAWRATAVGDSCIFHLRAGNLLYAFPLALAEEFNNRPHLLGSNIRLNGSLSGHLKRARGSAQPGDIFLLTTDALAAWALAEGGQAVAEPFVAAALGGEEPSVAPALRGGDRAAARLDAPADQPPPVSSPPATTENSSPWLALSSLQRHDEFAALVHDLRATGALRNDDVTLLRIQLI